MHKAFLSHSSSDKSLVAEVFRALGRNLAEMDEYTFESGLPGWETIVSSFDRCSLFVLFATEASAASDWVNREAKEAYDRIKKGEIKRILIITKSFSDHQSFVPKYLQDFTSLIGLKKPKPIARAITRHLIDISTRTERGSSLTDSFVGRDDELSKLKSLLLDASKKTTSISISGRDYMGRSMLLQRALLDIDPSMFFSESNIDFTIHDSCTNLAIKIHGIANDYISPEEIVGYSDKFRSDNLETCSNVIINMIEKLGKERQYIIISDSGGIIESGGSFTPLAYKLVEKSNYFDFPGLLFVTRRKPNNRLRASLRNTVFFDVGPLEPNAASQYVLQRSKQLKISLHPSQVEEIAELGFGVPRNYDYILERCRHYPIDVALGDSDDIMQYNFDSSNSYLRSISIGNDAINFLKILRLYPAIPAEFVYPLLSENDEHNITRAAKICAELLDWHIIQESDGVYSISSSLVGAIDRDTSLELSQLESTAIAKKMLSILSEYSEEGKIPVSAVDVAGISAIEIDKSDNWSRAFVLPSHYIYLARRCYDKRRYDKAIKFLENALSSLRLLSDSAFLQATRYLGMSAARLGNNEKIEYATRLMNASSDPKAKAWAAFIRGFKARLDGDADTAEEYYLEAERGIGNEFALAREMALTYLMQQKFGRALSYGEMALAKAPDNPYLLDAVIRAFSGLKGTDLTFEDQMTLEGYYRRLKDVGSRGESFYQVTMAERLLREGNAKAALNYANEAIEVSENLASVYLTRARVKIAMGQTKGASEDIGIAKSKKQSASYRVDYFEAQIDRVALELLIKEKKWDAAVRAFGRMSDAKRPGMDILRREIQTGIKFDNRNHSTFVRDFLRK